MKRKFGKLITFEGIDGSGKSTTLRDIKPKLQKFKIKYTFEPGGTKFANKIRNILLDTNYNLDKQTQMYLFSAARRDHVKKFIYPTLKNGTNIVSDRYLTSSEAYQSNYQHGKDINHVINNNKSAITINNQVIKPNLIIYFKATPQLIKQRLISRHHKQDNFDKLIIEHTKLQEKVLKNYKYALKNEKHFTISANLPRKARAKKAISAITKTI